MKIPEKCPVCLMKNYKHPRLQKVHKTLHDAILNRYERIIK